MKKRCATCGETKPVKQFSKHKGHQDGYQSQCKSCVKEYAQSEEGKQAFERYRQSEKGKRYKKLWGQSVAGKQAYRRYAQSDKGKQVKRRYAQSDKGKQAQRKKKATRNTHKTEAGGSYTTDQWHALCKFYNFRCLKCNKKLPFKKLTLDHIKPISRGGSSHIWNTQPLCGKCNTSKGDKEIDYRKTLPDWLNRDGPVWQQDRLF